MWWLGDVEGFFEISMENNLVLRIVLSDQFIYSFQLVAGQ